MKTGNLGVLRWAVKTLAFHLILAASLFIPAGTTRWTMGWVYLGMFAVTQVINAVVLIPSHRDLIVERSKMQAGTKSWDKLLSVLVALIGPLSIWITAGLDRRFDGSPEVPFGLQMVMLGVATGGALLATWAMAANQFFSSTVRIQTERGHRVVSRGPYRIVRHPGYAGGILFDLASPLILGSLWALIPAAATVLAIFLRTSLEDQTLQHELTGYPAYARRVHYRLVPGIW